MAPYSKDLQGTKLNPSWNHAVSAAVNCLKRSSSTWIRKAPSIRQTFCLDFVNICLSRIQATDSKFDWLEEYSALIRQLGEIYCSYAGKSNLTILSDELPPEILSNPSTAVKGYYFWIQKIHKILSQWKAKLDNNVANYDEIHVYIHKWKYIHDTAQSVSASDVVISVRRLRDIEETFLKWFEYLNILLLKYIQGDPKPSWYVSYNQVLIL